MNSKPSDQRPDMQRWRKRYLRTVFSTASHASKKESMELKEGYAHAVHNLPVVCRNDIPAGEYHRYIEQLLPQVYKRGAWRESVPLLESAVIKKKDSRDILVTLDWLSRLYEWLGQYAKSEERAAEGLRRAREFNDKPLLYEFLVRLAKIRRTRGDYREALEFYHEAENLLAGDEAYRERLAALPVSTGLVYWHLNEYEQALACYEKAIALCKETGNHEKEGQARNNMGLVYTEIGMYPEALECIQQALESARKAGDRREIALNEGNIGMVYFYLGQYETAITYITSALNNAKDLKSKYRTAKAQAQLSAIHLRRGIEPGDLDEAARYALAAYRTGIEAGIIHSRIQGASYLALCRQRQGKIPEALELSSEAVRLLDQRTAFDGLEEEIYFNHYLLLSGQDKKESLRFLQKSYDCIQKKISRLENPGFKKSMEQNVKLNRLILERCRSCQVFCSCKDKGR